MVSYIVSKAWLFRNESKARLFRNESKAWLLCNENEEGREMKSIGDIVEILLENRGIRGRREREEFFNPPHPEKISVSKLGISDSQLKKAVKRIKRAIDKKEKIIVYGDYDADGICATAILWETLHFLGARALPYIPDRFSEGYGLNEESIKLLKKKDPQLSLIITIDHGIVAHEKVDFARELGLDVIVTDHHEAGEEKPRAHAVVHTTKISGSAVAWVLSRELLAQNQKSKRVQSQTIGKNQSDITSDHLGLAALGTIADVLPLVGHNRSIVVHGFEILRRTERPGVEALCREAGIDQGKINTFHIGFILGPRLNAMGRIEHAIDSLRLLCTRSKGKASQLALKLGKANRLRQEKTEATVSHIETYFAPSWVNGNLPKLLFIHHESYEEGVIGIVAARLVEKYHRPAIVVSRGEELSKASARSIRGVNIVETIRKAGDGLLVAVGGHTMAAGLTVKTRDLEILAEKLAEVSEKEIGEEVLAREVRVDCDLDFSLISRELTRELAKFAPFGYGNPEPTFRTRGVYVEDARLVGKNNEHLKLRLYQSSNDQAVRSDSSRIFDAIAFRMGGHYPSLSPDKPVDVVYSVEEDEWRGNRKLQLKLRSIHFA